MSIVADVIEKQEKAEDNAQNVVKDGEHCEKKEMPSTIRSCDDTKGRLTNCETQEEGQKEIKPEQRGLHAPY